MAGGPSKKKFRDAFANCSERVRQYKPFILAETKKYRQKYNQKYHRYRIPFWLMVGEAVRLAEVADKRFDEQRGHDFSTFLRHHLKGLNRFAQRLRRPPKKEIVEEDWERENRKRKCEDARAYGLSWHGRTRRKRDGFPELDRLLFDLRGEVAPSPRNYARWKKELGPKGLARVAEHLAGPDVVPGLNQKQRAVLAWMVGDLLGRDTRTMMQAASDIGITRGYVSKVVCKIANHFLPFWTNRLSPASGR